MFDRNIEILCKERECCTTLQLTSDGLSREQWPEAFGVYRYLDKDDKGGPIYAHVKFKLYFIKSSYLKGSYLLIFLFTFLPITSSNIAGGIP